MVDYRTGPGLLDFLLEHVERLFDLRVREGDRLVLRPVQVGAGLVAVVRDAVPAEELGVFAEDDLCGQRGSSVLETAR